MQATYILDDTTFDAVKSDLDSAVGKTVTLTGAETAGYGTTSDKLLGVIMKVEKDKCATIRTGWYSEGVHIGSGTVSPGTVVKVDGAGGLAAASTQTNYGPVVIRIDGIGAEATAVIKF